ncbi:MAG: hypothetical protein MUC49_04555 [Raineya sp.]|jgi:hypothetical protein|nr:hypothetical protein [Raineya sp.]
MRNIFFLLFFSFFWFTESKAQKTDLVLGIPECHQTYNEWDKVKKALQILDGVEIKGVCTRHDCIILQVDRGLMASNQLIFDKIKEANSKYTIFVKEATFETMMAVCEQEIAKPK